VLPFLAGARGLADAADDFLAEPAFDAEPFRAFPVPRALVVEDLGFLATTSTPPAALAK
jgi:hypothetical protein